MSFKEIISLYNQNNHRILMMKLSIEKSFEELYNIHLKNKDFLKEIPDINILFNEMK